jgi:hypothetical protein
VQFFNNLIIRDFLNPNANNIGVVNLIDPPARVANQLKILIPVGTAIIIVAAVKYALVSTCLINIYLYIL